MVVASLTEGPWDLDACRVDGLPHVLEADSSGDLLDQDWRHALSSQLLVDAQEVDFSHFNRRAMDVQMDWNARNKGK